MRVIRVSLSESLEKGVDKFLLIEDSEHRSIVMSHGTSEQGYEFRNCRIFSQTLEGLQQEIEQITPEDIDLTIQDSVIMNYEEQSVYDLFANF